MQEFLIQSSENGLTLEKYVFKVLPAAPLSFIYKLFRKKDIKVNGHHEDKKFRLSTDDKVAIYITDEQIKEFQKEKALNPNLKVKEYIIYEDDNVLFINKPRGLLVQKSAPQDESLDQLVIEYLMDTNQYNPDKEKAFVPGPAHRLDRNTSGIVAFGKNHEALTMLFDLFKDHDLINKHYLALVVGNVEKDKDIITAPLKKDEKNNKVVVSKDGKSAQTVYKVLKRFNGYTLLNVTLLTGRTHQIRVHMSYINHPIVGDAKYGNFAVNKEFKDEYHFNSQFLHAYKLGFGELKYPLNNLSKKEFIAEPREEIANILTMLENINEE